MVRMLKNGAKVLKSFWDRPNGSIVLCSWKDDAEFVTWRIDDEGNAFLGHYFETYGEAFRDFMDRGAKL
jgi:hypothetical protein